MRSVSPFVGDGGSTGHDLTQAAGCFTIKDLAESIIDPSKVISGQYKTTIVKTKGVGMQPGASSF